MEKVKKDNDNGARLEPASRVGFEGQTASIATGEMQSGEDDQQETE